MAAWQQVSRFQALERLPGCIGSFLDCRPCCFACGSIMVAFMAGLQGVLCSVGLRGCALKVVTGTSSSGHCYRSAVLTGFAYLAVVTGVQKVITLKAKRSTGRFAFVGVCSNKLCLDASNDASLRDAIPHHIECKGTQYVQLGRMVLQSIHSRCASQPWEGVAS